MNSDRFNVWLQMSGMVGIIASLVFVGLQLKQSQDIAIAAQYAERSSVATEYWWSAANHPHFLAITGKNHREHLQGIDVYEDEWTDEEVGLWYAITRAIIASWDNNYFQYVSGFMTEEAWSAYASRMRNDCRLERSVGAVVSNHPEVLRASFVEYCLKLIED